MRKVAKVDIDYLTVFNGTRSRSFLSRMLGVFTAVRLVAERFPVRTKIHGGLKAALFNVVVSAFVLLPGALVRRTGHHRLAFCDEAGRQPG